MEKIDNRYIGDAIDILESSIGFRDPIEYSGLLNKLRNNEVKECIKEIALYLGLPIEVSVSYVSKEYRSDGHQSFSSKQLVKTEKSGKGAMSITAQVDIPSYLPMYGSPAFSGFLINVKVSENCTSEPMVFISVMAHELCHIVLYSIWHKEKDNEYFTDLSAMMLGFSEVMRIGRKVVHTSHSTNQTVTSTTKYGYLSDSQFNFAHKKVSNLVRQHVLVKNKTVVFLGKILENTAVAGGKIVKFEEYITYLDTHLKTKISPKDGAKISSFHQFGYIDESRSKIKSMDVVLRELSMEIQNIHHYTKKNIERIFEIQQSIESVNIRLKTIDTDLSADIDVLKKYMPLGVKLRAILGKIGNIQRTTLSFIKARFHKNRQILGYEKDFKSKIISGLIITGIVGFLALLVWLSIGDRIASTSDGRVNVGKYSCLLSDASTADSLNPPNSERRDLEAESESIDVEKQTLDTEYTDESNRFAVSAHNSKVASYNARIAAYKTRESAYNNKVQIYNSFLETHCTRI